MIPKILILVLPGALSLSPLLAQEGFESLPPEQQALIQKALAQGDEENRKARLTGLFESLKSRTENSQQVISEMNSLKEMTLTEEEVSGIYAALLKSPAPWVRQISLEHLREFGHDHPAIQSLVPQITEILENGQLPDYLRGAAAQTLGALNPTVETAGRLAGFLNLSDSPDAFRLGILGGLSAMGPAATSAGEAVSRQLERGSTALRYAALETLAKVGNPDPKKLTASGNHLMGVIAGLRALNDKSANEPGKAESLLSKQLGRQTDPLVKTLVLEELGTLGIKTPESVGAALQVLTIDDSFLVNKARQLLLSRNKIGADHLNILVQGMQSRERPRKEVSVTLLSRLGVAAMPAVPAVVAELQKINSRTPLFYRGGLLDILRTVGEIKDDGVTAGKLVALLPETSNLVAGLSKENAAYLRGYLILTLSDIGIPAEAYPFVLDGLANSDNSMGHVFGASAIAAPFFKDQSEVLAPILARAFDPEFSDAPLYFERFGQSFGEGGSVTSARIEAIRALGSMGPAASGQLAGLKKLEAKIRKIDEPEILQVIIESIKKIESP